MNQTAIEAEITSLLTVAKFTHLYPASSVRRILSLRPQYQSVSDQTGVPVVWLMAINERESSSNMHTYLGNGQSLNRRTTLVPKGRGPFDTWPLGAVDALRFDKIDQVKDWTFARAGYEAEAWNGFGYRMHGAYSAYVWAGSSIYTKGFYTSDGKWDREGTDQRFGVIPIMIALISACPELVLPGTPGTSPSIPAPLPVPSEHSVHEHDTEWLQVALNQLIMGQQGSPLVVDGSFGRRTRAAVMAFQKLHGLDEDGIAGPDTTAAIEEALAAAAAPKKAVALTFKTLNDAAARAGYYYSTASAPEAPAPLPVSRVAPSGGTSCFPRHADLAYFICSMYQYPDYNVTWDRVPDYTAPVVWGIKRVEDTNVLVFQGTASFEDLLNDFRAFPALERYIGHVHTGFLDGVEDVIKQVRGQRLSGRLVVTGHSLGAARATIATALLMQARIPVTERVVFGSPKPGFSDFANYVSAVPATSYINRDNLHEDLITDLPFTLPGLEYHQPTPFTPVTSPPDWTHPWGPFAWHDSTLYHRGLLNVG